MTVCGRPYKQTSCTLPRGHSGAIHANGVIMWANTDGGGPMEQAKAFKLGEVPPTVETDRQRQLYSMCNEGRQSLRITGETIDQLRLEAAVLIHTESLSSEVVANITLAYRAVEDASMRLGKALQHLDRGVSVYDPRGVVGPNGTQLPEHVTQAKGGAADAERQETRRDQSDEWPTAQSSGR